jgi:hypothetical protein
MILPSPSERDHGLQVMINAQCGGLGSWTGRGRTEGRVAVVDDLLEEYRRATVFFDAGDPIRAAQILEPIVEAEPSQSDVRLLLARRRTSVIMGWPSLKAVIMILRDP